MAGIVQWLWELVQALGLVVMALILLALATALATALKAMGQRLFD